MERRWPNAGPPKFFLLSRPIIPYLCPFFALAAYYPLPMSNLCMGNRHMHSLQRGDSSRGGRTVSNARIIYSCRNVARGGGDDQYHYFDLDRRAYESFVITS
jgi:hypothetical protein